MSHEQHDDDLSRRTFMKAAGVVAGGSLLGAGSAAASTATTEDELAEFLDYRVQEARKVWNRGYRGRIDRPTGLTDSGVDARHPDVGPWNGVRVETDQTGPTLVDQRFERLETAESFAGSVGPGAVGVPDRSPHELSVPGEAGYLEAQLTWEPGDEDHALVLEREADGEWEEVDRHGGVLSGIQHLGELVDDGTYRLVTETEASVDADYEIDVLYYRDTADETTEDVTEKQYETVDTRAWSGVIATGLRYNVPPFVVSEDADRISAVLTWEPSTGTGPEPNNFHFWLEDENGNEVASSDQDFVEDTQSENRETLTADVIGGEEYAFRVTSDRGGGSWEITADVETVTSEEVVGTETELVPPTVDPDDLWSVTDPTDKVVGWHDANDRYGELSRPRDQEAQGHGTHVSGIMAGSGRASAIDTDATRIETERTPLVLGDALQYEIDAEAGTGVFASVYGHALDVHIEGPNGQPLDESKLVGYDSSVLDNNVVEAPTVHDAGTETYTVRVRPAEGELASAGYLNRVAYGPMLPPAETQADRTGEAPGLRSGLAPDAGIVGVQGLSGAAEAVANYADFYAETFGLRTLNMSWGAVGGIPTGAAGAVSVFADPSLYKAITEGGILTVAAAGNSFTPANGNSMPAVADEAVSVVSTGPLDGIVTYSSGGVGAVDEDGEGAYTKPDVTAPGGRAPIYPASLAVPNYDLIYAAESGDPAVPESEQTIRDYYGTLGTSMASPYACGATNLVAEAMDAEYGDAPEAIELPAPADTGFDDVMRLKQAILATASETAFTAAPYHTIKSAPKGPTYDFGGRDPYEGYGRINPDAAVDAVTETLFDATGLGADETETASISGEVGLDVPRDSRAVARNVVVPDGSLEVSMAFDRLAGGDAAMADGDPHLDLFVYDAESPSDNGDPTIVASAQALEGVADLSLDVSTGEGDGSQVYYVVAKLVNVPGLVNGFDVQAQFDLDVTFEAAQLPVFSAGGSRADDGTAFTAGQTNHVEITVDDIGGVDEAYLYDVIPLNWEVESGAAGDAQRRDEDADWKLVPLGPVSGDALGWRGSIERDYYVEAPDETGEYEFGPALVVIDDPIDHGYRREDDGNAWAEVGGSDRIVIVGVDQNDPSGSATGAVEDGADDGVDTVGDTVNEVL